ncbi:MAG TPA: DUF4388 domain-containing protein, partial [Thermoanaerobaculia bacterium]|nr:DUF4388 domain-containing protein [Thermoanaerobaculia bacterium]
MSISGSLKDVSVADVMQFIHLGRRTGTLLLARGSERSMIGFHCGKLVSAQAPRTPKLGDLLISSGMIDRGILESAIREQNNGLERRSLGQILVGSGSIDAEGLRQVIARQIEQAVSEVMVWDTGTFEFAIDDLRPIDDIALYPSDVLPDADINTQMVLLEAARIFDERNRDRAEGYEEGDSTHPTMLDSGTEPQFALMERGETALEPREPEPIHAAERLQLHIVTSDTDFADLAAEALAAEVAWAGVKAPGQAGLAGPGEPPPIILVDLRQGEMPLEQAASLRRSRPRASLVALVDSGTPFAKVYEAGVLSAIPAEVEAVVACVENVIESRRDLVRGARPGEPKAG